jgi:hypothetical protein
VYNPSDLDITDEPVSPRSSAPDNGELSNGAAFLIMGLLPALLVGFLFPGCIAMWLMALVLWLVWRFLGRTRKGRK